MQMKEFLMKSFERNSIFRQSEEQKKNAISCGKVFTNQEYNLNNCNNK